MVGQAHTESMTGFAYWQRAARDTVRGLREMGERPGIGTNIAAGLTVTLVALPLNLALAVACGLPPSVGLVSGAVAGVLGAMLGGTRLSVTGPEVALAPITFEIVSRYGFEGLLATTLLAGLIQIAFGVCRLGRLVHAIPMPVIGGFLAAVGLLVLDTQLPRLLGLPSAVAAMSSTQDFQLFTEVNASTLGIGLVVIAAMLLLPRLSRRIPAPLAGLAIAVLAVVVLRFPLATVAPIEATLPKPGFPSFAGLDLLALLPEALALALLASIDSLLCAVSVDSMTGGERTRTDQELVAQGLANLGSAMFGGMPVAAAVVRSAAAIEAGATTRLAPLVQSLLLALVLVVLAPLVSYVPLVALAAILLVVGLRLVQYRQLVQMWRITRYEAVIFIATALGILLTDFVVGVGIGMLLALVHFAVQQRASLRARQLETMGITQVTEIFSSGGEQGELRVIRLEGPLFFGSQSILEEALITFPAPRRLLVDVSTVSTVDVSGAFALTNALRRLSASGTQVWVNSAGRPLEPVLQWALDHSREHGIRPLESGNDDALEAARVTARARRTTRPSRAPTSAQSRNPAEEMKHVAIVR
jgi:SulP family sulfate permease